MATTPVKKKTQTPPINADPPVLGPTQYPGPRGRPVRTRSQNWDPQSWVRANQRPERSGGKPPQGSEQVPTLDTGDNSYKPYDGPPPPMGGDRERANMGNFRGNIRDASMNRYPGVPDWGGSGGGMKREPRGYGGDFKGVPGQGGEQVPGGRAIGGPKVDPNLQAWTSNKQWNGQPTPGGQAQFPPQGGPAPDGRPGRQPLRPGMEYRPGGGQRPSGGGMQGAPQGGGQMQWVGENNLNQWGGFDPAQHAQWSNGQLPQGPAGGGQWGGQDPQQMNEWRRRLMEMQQQGPMNNQFYGAF